MSRCPHCEAEIDDDARFCGACGRPISPTAISQRAAVEAVRKAVLKGAPAAATIKVSPDPPPPLAAAPQAASPGASQANPFAPLPAAAVVNSSPQVAPAAASAAAAPSPERPLPGLRPPAQPLENLIGRTLNHRFLVEDKV